MRKNVNTLETIITKSKPKPIRSKEVVEDIMKRGIRPHEKPLLQAELDLLKVEEVKETEEVKVEEKETEKVKETEKESK